MKPKITLRRGEQVKRTKSEQLIEILEKQGWKRETAGGDKKPDISDIGGDDNTPAKPAKGKK